MTFLALLAYVTPWIVNPSAGLTLGAYDLAEWASLHPEVRNSSPALLTSLLLRLPLSLFALLVGFCAPLPALRSYGWWVAFMIVLFLTASALPPLEFFIEAREDTNYQQQFLLSCLALFGGLIGLAGILSRFRAYMTILVALIVIVTSVMGLFQARQLMIGFSMPVVVGYGSVGVIAVVVGMSIWQWRLHNPYR